MPAPFPTSVSFLTTPVQTNTYFLSNQLSPTVTAIGGDRFVVTWMSWQQDGSGYGVFGQVLDDQLQKIGSEFQVDTFESGNQSVQDVAALPDGGFVVVWESSADSGIWMRTYSQDGVPSSEPFAIVDGVGSEELPKIAGIQGSELLVALYNEDYSSGRINQDNVYTQIINLADFSQSAPILINSNEQSDRGLSSITMLEDGRYLLLTNGLDGSGSGIFGQFLDQSGAPIGEEFRLNSDPVGSQMNAVAHDLGSGNLVVAWMTADTGSSSGPMIVKVISSTDGSTVSERVLTTTYARTPLEASELPNGDIFFSWGSSAIIYDPENDDDSGIVSIPTSGRGNNGTVVDEAGIVTVTWAEEGFDGDGFGIRTARLILGAEGIPTPVDDPFLVGSDGDDVLSGPDYGNIIYAEAGDDELWGNGGDDQLDGGSGIDTAVYSGAQHNYILTLSATSQVLEDRRLNEDGADTLSNIEFLAFGNGSGPTFDIQQFGGASGLTAQDFESFIEFYIAYFNRAPDAVGLNFWGTAFANGVTLEEIATYFIDQDETRATYPDGTSNTDFVTAVYDNVLGRIPDQAGFDFWVDMLNRSEETGVTRDQFILEVLRGVQDGSPDRAYLDTKVDIGAYFAVHRGMSDTDNASAAMMLFDGSQGSVNDAVAAIDGYYQDALDPINGEFLMQVVGVLDNPFA